MPEEISIGNVHTHHFIGNYIPDAIFAQQTGHTEKKLRSFAMQLIGTLFLPKRKRNFLRLLDSKDVNDVREIHLEDMQKGSKVDYAVDYAVVLLVDYAMAAPKPVGEKLVPYPTIMENTAKSCARNPFTFFLFHYFDPRWMVMTDNALGKRSYRIENGAYKGLEFKDTTFAIRLLLKAFYEYGIVGIKLYPAHGYHPIPEENLLEKNLIQYIETPLNADEREIVKYNMEYLYEFAHTHSLPLLSHCGPGGSYNVLVSERLLGRHVWRYTNPMNFSQVVARRPGCQFRVCLAHMGGKPHKIEEAELAKVWRQDILQMIKDFPGHFYTDLSYDLSNFLSQEINDKKKRKEGLSRCLCQLKKEYLSNPDYRQYFLFGTDWPMGYALFEESEYVRVCWEALKDEGNPNGGVSEMQAHYFSRNIADFIFGKEHIIPENYIKFIEGELKAQGIGEIPLQNWIAKQETPDHQTIYKLLY